MKMIPMDLRDRKAQVVKGGVALVTLVLSLGLTASAKDKAPEASQSSQKASGRNWFQVGLASWYGRHFQGKMTADGESFDMNDLTCAHRTLPMNSWIRVTNLKNRKSIFVRVNDRGPVPGNRIVDLSYRAARAVGLTDRGVGKVKIEPLVMDDPTMAREMVSQIGTVGEMGRIGMPLIPVYNQ